MMPKFRVSIERPVHESRSVDHRRLMKAARDRAEESGCKRGLIKTEQDAVHWLRDPGSAFEDGFEIERASCDKL